MTGSDPSMVNVTTPATTAPEVNWAPSFVTLKAVVEPFPEIVKVMVLPGVSEVWVHFCSTPSVHMLNTEIVVRADPLLFVTSKFVEVAVLTMEPPLLLERWLKTMLKPLMVSVVVLLMVKVFARPADSRETVPAITRVLNSCVASIFSVLLDPSIVMVLVPAVNVLPAPLVSQLPWTVHDPLVSVIVPDDPPVIVTSVNV